MECMVCQKEIKGEHELCNECYRAGQELLEKDEEFRKLNQKINQRKNRLVKKVIKEDKLLQDLIEVQAKRILEKRRG